MAAADLTLSDLDSRMLVSDQQISPETSKTSLELERVILDEIRRTQSSNKLANSDTIPAIIAKRHGLDPHVISTHLSDMIAEGKINNITYRGKKSFRIPSQLDASFENDSDSPIRHNADHEDTAGAQMDGSALHFGHEKQLNKQLEVTTKLHDENESLKRRINELENDKSLKFSDGAVRPRNTGINEFSKMPSPLSTCGSKDGSSSACKAPPPSPPPPPSQNVMQAKVIQCLQERIDSLERQLNQKQHIIELLLYNPTIRNMHTNGNEAKMSMETTKVTTNDAPRGLDVENNAPVGLGNAANAARMTNKGLNNPNIVLESIEIKNDTKGKKKQRPNKRQRESNRRSNLQKTQENKTVGVDGKNTKEGQIPSGLVNQNQTETRNNLLPEETENKNQSEIRKNPLAEDTCNKHQTGMRNNPPPGGIDNMRKAEIRKNGKKTTFIIGDSLLKDVKGWELNDRCGSEENVYVKSFSGSTVSDMESYVKPTIDRKPDCIVLHVGTNDLGKKSKSEVEIAESIVNLAKNIAESGIKPIVSAIVPRYDALEPKRVKVNYVLRDLCEENKISYTDHANIDPSKNLNRSKVHLNKSGIDIFANNLFEVTKGNLQH